MSIKIDQAFISTILNAGLELDVVHENGGYSQHGSYALIPYGQGAYNSPYASIKGVYKPSTRRPYLEIKTFPAGTSSYTRAHTDESVGLFQCIVKYPDDAGAFDIKTKAEEILTLFKAGSIIAYDGQQVNIVSNNRDGGRTEGGFYQIVCRANYRAFVPK